MSTLVWFRNDLRTTDNPALFYARQQGPVTACFVVSDMQWRAHDVGDVRLAFLGRSVNELAQQLALLGIPLQIINAAEFSDVPKAVLELAQRCGASALAYNAEYPVNEKQRDLAVERLLTSNHISCQVYHGGITLPPGSVMTKSDSPYSVFSPFKRRWLEVLQPDEIKPLAAPPAQSDPVPVQQLESLAGVELSLAADLWPAGEIVAREKLKKFFRNAVSNYAKDRDVPSVNGTSTLSPYLSVGSISSNQCLYAAQQYNKGALNSPATQSWVNEIIWREFYRHVIALYPHVNKNRAFRTAYDALRWRDAPHDLLAWQRGETGYPLVDAGMRQLNKTGWMHNRLRMVTAMFLTKHLLIDWRQGERYFMQKLVDGDFASNNGGWQWSASTGTDAAPYFRIFNPTTQGQRFDKTGVFTRAMIPALSQVPDRHLFEPHKSELQIDYPQPIVEHTFARQRAIDLFKAIGDNTSA